MVARASDSASSAYYRLSCALAFLASPAGIQVRVTLKNSLEQRYAYRCAVSEGSRAAIRCF